MVSYIAQEKELRQKELMKMMSVTESDIGWSWFVTFMVSNIITATLVTWVSDVLYEETEVLILWVFWLLTFTSIVVFCMTIAALTSKAIRAVFLGILIFFCGAFITILVDLDGNSTLIAVLSLHPIGAFSYGLSQIGRLEDDGTGLSFNRISLEIGIKNDYSFKNTLGALMFDCLFWGLLTWYFNRVIKPDYGQALPFYFPLTVSYWCPSRQNVVVSDVEEAGSQNFSMGWDIPYEPVVEELRRQTSEGQSIEIHHLRKEFDEKAAVDNLNLSIYNGQVTALLGKNGAGKTTTIAMLTGAMAPTSGYALVSGKDIRTQMPDIRKNIGICLQHDCLFPTLTVREHLQFFSRVKGVYKEMSKEEAEEHIDQAIRDVALFEKRNTFSSSLSGGMKRKLSVAIAFIGGSKVVLLDEPTSGMVRSAPNLFAK
jgi:ATP-binding cassette, subfamily A (ABC1), member 3